MLSMKLAGQTPKTEQERQQLEDEGFIKCRNPVCSYYIAPFEYEAMENEGYHFSCPSCKMTYPLLDPTPFRIQNGGVQGNPYENPDVEGIRYRDYETFVGLSMKEQGDIGEGVIKNLKNLGDYGPITWWSDTYNDPIDGGAGDWAIEVKTLCIDVKNHRFIPGPQPRKEQMIARAKELGFSGILGVLVILDYRRSVADIYVKEMPLEPWIHPRNKREIAGPFAYRTGNEEKFLAEIPFDNPFLNPQSDEPQSSDIPF